MTALQPLDDPCHMLRGAGVSPWRRITSAHDQVWRTSGAGGENLADLAENRRLRRRLGSRWRGTSGLHRGPPEAPIEVMPDMASEVTGYVLRITCGSEAATIVSPTSAAAVGQDIGSTRVFVLAVGALFAPDRFPAGKVVLCDLENLTTEGSFEELPFLIKGAR